MKYKPHKKEASAVICSWCGRECMGEEVRDVMVGEPDDRGMCKTEPVCVDCLMDELHPLGLWED